MWGNSFLTLSWPLYVCKCTACKGGRVFVQILCVYIVYIPPSPNTCKQGKQKAKWNNWCEHNDKITFLNFSRKDYLPLGTFTVV